jgi:hypothetical protein
MSIDEAIVDFSAGLLLRYFRRGAAISIDSPRLDYRRDINLLKGHWAISGPVRTLVSYILAHPHESQSLLSFRTRIDDAIARGRIDARRTWEYRLRSGLPSAIVAEEPIRSFNTGPNLVLAWVLREADAFTARLSLWQDTSSPYATMIEEAQREMRTVQRLEALREPLRAVSVGQRPGQGAVRTAARARQRIYRFAVEAYLLLQGLERGDQEAMNIVARTSLIGPIEEWRRFELAVGLAVGEALATACQESLQLHLLGGKSSGPLVTAGRFTVYWQQKTLHYNAPDLEPSELVTQKILKAYNLSSGADRPDLVVVDQERSAVSSIIEVKYLTGDTANARFREAVDQIVRYARGYAPLGETGNLIAHSLVVLSRNAPVLMDEAAAAPSSIDFAGLMRNELVPWAHRIAENARLGR